MSGEEHESVPTSRPARISRLLAPSAPAVAPPEASSGRAARTHPRAEGVWTRPGSAFPVSRPAPGFLAAHRGEGGPRRTREGLSRNQKPQLSSECDSESPRGTQQEHLREATVNTPRRPRPSNTVERKEGSPLVPQTDKLPKPPGGLSPSRGRNRTQKAHLLRPNPTGPWERQTPRQKAEEWWPGEGVGGELPGPREQSHALPGTAPRRSCLHREGGRAGRRGPWEAHGILELASRGPARSRRLPGPADGGSALCLFGSRYESCFWKEAKPLLNLREHALARHPAAAAPEVGAPGGSSTDLLVIAAGTTADHAERPS